MTPQRGFTLIEAAISAAILMLGVIALIEINRATSSQIQDIRRTTGQPAIAERLLHDQYEAIVAPVVAPVSPNVPRVPPLGLDGVVYDVEVTGDILRGPGNSIRCYTLRARFGPGGASLPEFRAGPNLAPTVTVCRPS
jgi:Tfp pilus assembly protein PilE